jgi:hypothetical protein
MALGFLVLEGGLMGCFMGISFWFKQRLRARPERGTPENESLVAVGGGSR